MHAEIRRVKTILISILLLISTQALAVITIQSVSGVSYFEQDTNKNFTIYGGMTGKTPVANTVLDCTGDSSATCDSCALATAAPATACNQKSVYPLLKIGITFSSSVALNAAKVKVTTDASTGATEATEFALSPSTVTAAAGEVKTVFINWAYLCENDSGFGGNNCLPKVATDLEAAFITTSRKINLYVDQNADGNLTGTDEKISMDAKLHFIKSDSAANNQQTFCNSPQEALANGAIGNCGYALGIGDSKLYIQQLFGISVGGNGTAPAKTTLAPDWYGVALFPQDAANVNSIPSSSGAQIRIYDATYGITENTVTGLQNYRNYCLLMGNINKAQNIYKFNATLDTAKTCGQPSEVIGLLSDKSCFIATAAFGSDMANQVQLLRQFRNEFLLTNDYGKLFVKTYYRFSPPLAHFIEHSEFLKSITRTSLYPVIALAWLAVHYGILPTGLFVFFIFSALYFTLRKRKSIDA